MAIGRAISGAMLLLGATAWAAPNTDDAIDWQTWSDAAFEQARAQGKPVYLYLEAVWCHWCHVMQRETFGDPAVAELLNEQVVPVRVDHDAMPDLANRYRAWGWPAQIWLTADGRELAKRSGYMPPDRFRSLVQRLADDPDSVQTEPANDVARITGDGALTSDQREALEARHRRAYDPEHGGLDLKKKFLDADSVAYDLWLARQGDSKAADRVARTLAGAIKLIDPVWGGAYQYSVHGNWDNPHYEKLMRTQARYLRVFSLAHQQSPDPAYRQALNDIRDYLARFLSSDEGVFFVSQDADLIKGQKAHDYFALDDAARRARGIPAIDRHRYASTNGQAIEGLAMMFAATGDEQALAMARRAADWALGARRNDAGGFGHAAADDGPYLADSLFMARAMLELHRVTGEREWLKRAATTADFMTARFRREAGGFAGGAEGTGPLRPVPDIDENIATVRFLNLLSHYTGEPRYREAAEHGMRYLAASDVVTQRISDPGILLAGRELGNDPVHVTVVSRTENAEARGLFRRALEVPGWYRRVEWWNRARGALPNADVTYPDLERSAAFFCADQRCSLPQFSVAGFESLLAERLGR
ncbi:MAG: DUF255 domain-containing protein [Salinisphaeraceae bacterium]